MSPEVEVGYVRAGIHGRHVVKRAERDPRGTLLGFHGYGETAEKHVEQLVALPGSDQWDLVAVNALHQFYTRSGEVVASWMTSSDRELMIQDNRAYVAAVVDQVVRARPIVVVGFSQGVAMAYRAAALLELDIGAVVSLAGDLPPELADSDLTGFPPVLIARGDGEEWYTAERATADAERLRHDGVRVQEFEFAGGHEWTEEIRRKIAGFVAGVSASASASD